MTLAQKFFQSIFGQKTKVIIFNFTALVCLLILSFIYLYQVNKDVSSRLRIETLKEELKSLQLENQKLLKQTTSMGSMANIYALVQELRMEKVGQIDYLAPTGEIFARK